MQDSPVSVVLTRFELPTAFFMPGFWLSFRAIHREARRDVDGLIASVFLLGGLRVCYTLSIWRGPEAIERFNEIFLHVGTANWALRRCSWGGALHIWSTQLKFIGVSHNLVWKGIDLLSALNTNKKSPTRPQANR